MNKDFLSMIAAGSLLFVLGCSHDKYDERRVDIERQEAIEMINQSNDIEIDKRWGDDKIILKDQ